MLRAKKILLIFSLPILLLVIFFINIKKSDALTIVPALVEVTGAPGETLVQKIGLYNETEQILTIYPRTENFKPQSGTNAPQFLGDANPFGAARWIFLPFKKITLKSGEKKEFFATIKISALAEPGGHYAAILWAEQVGKNAGIGVNSRLASLFLFKIKGDIKEEAKLVSFQKVGADRPIDFLLRLENSGNVHLKPGGIIEIINWRGKKVGELPVNVQGASVMPQSQRQFFARWGGVSLWPGPYSAKMRLIYGESQQELIGKTSFWLWPEAIGSKILGLIVLLFLIFVATRLARKKIIMFILALIIIFLSNYVLAASTSTSGTTTVSGEYTVSTGGGGGGGGNPPSPTGDTIPPSVITDLTAGTITTSSVALSWTASGDDGNVGTSTRYNLKYSTSPITEASWSSASSFISMPAIKVAGSLQSVTVSGLFSNTKYYFAIKAMDEKLNWSALSNVVSATTLQEGGQPSDTTPPIITSIVVESGIYTAKIIWHTNELADSQIAYGLTQQLGTLSASADFVTNHFVNLTDLTPDSIYYFKIVSTDEAGNQAVGLQNGAEIGQFKTSKDTMPPANVSNFQAQGGDKKIYLSWVNPSDGDFWKVMLLRSPDHYPTSQIESIEEFFSIFGKKNQAISYIDKKNIINGKTYYYIAVAADVNKNAASGAMAQATPQSAGQPPLIGDIVQCSDGADNDSDGYIDYPNDLGCVNPQDDNETGEAAPATGGVGAITELQLFDFLFSIAKGQIVIPTKFNIGILTGAGLRIILPQSKIAKSVDSIILNVAGGSYLFNLQNGQWQTEISAPPIAGVYQAVFLINFSDQTKNIISWQLEVRPYGQIYEKVAGQKKPVVGANVLLFQDEELWSAGNFYQSNPQITGEDGWFGFLVPPGKYVLQIEKDGYAVEKIVLDVDGTIINSDAELLYIPPLLKDVIMPGVSLAQNAQNVLENLGEKAQFISKKVGKEISQNAQKAISEVSKIIQNPEAQKTAEQVVAPVVAGAAAAAATATVGWTSLLNYLRFLFTQPALLFKRRKRKKWGVVYNSLTKIPLGLMTVRLIDATSGRIAQSRVTDGEGRYAFFPAVGSYKLEVSVAQFDFPSQFFSGLREDGQFVDLYHGEVIEVKEKGATITANIPLDPAGAERPIGHLIWQLTWRRLQNVLSIISILVAVGFVIWVPGIITGGLLAVQVVFYALFKHLTTPPQPKSWGIIYDERNSLPLTQAIARIFDKQYNKLLETQVTDKSGRYAFLVGRNEYYVTYEKNGYEKKQSAIIDLKDNPELAASVGIDTGLKPVELDLGSVGDKNEEEVT